MDTLREQHLAELIVNLENNMESPKKVDVPEAGKTDGSQVHVPNSTPSQSDVKPGDKKKMKKEKLVGENFERINFLVQASRLIGSVDTGTSCRLGKLGTAIGKKCQLRISPTLKRLLCKGCGGFLDFGTSAKVHLAGKRQKCLIISCLTCSAVKRLPTNPRYKLWPLQKAAVIV